MSADPFDDGIDWAAFDPDAAVASARGGNSANNNKHGAPNDGGMQKQQQPDVKRAKTAAAAAPVNSYGSAKTSINASAPAPVLGFAAPSSAAAVTVNNPNLEQSLCNTLERYFGHTSFRPGQLDAITAILGDVSTGQAPRDVAIFWATGAGKSITYQIPPLHTGKVAVVVSPLISLMQDQVGKLNGLVGGNDGGGNNDVATYLGSGQLDPHAEEKALSGALSAVPHCHRRVALHERVGTRLPAAVP